jgi:hypothetical protein
MIFSQDEVDNILSHLPPRHAAIVRQYYGIGEDKIKIKQIAAMHSISKQRISQILQRCNRRYLPSAFAGPSGKTEAGKPELRLKKLRLKTCIWCGKEFIGTARSRYCSRLCRSRASYRSMKPVMAIEKPCENCGRTFTSTPQRRFCTRNCAAEKTYRERTLKGGWQC